MTVACASNFEPSGGGPAAASCGASPGDYTLGFEFETVFSGEFQGFTLERILETVMMILFALRSLLAAMMLAVVPRAAPLDELLM